MWITNARGKLAVVFSFFDISTCKKYLLSNLALIKN